MAFKITDPATDKAMISSYISGCNASCVARDFHVSLGTVLRRLKESNIAVRLKGRVPPAQLNLDADAQCRFLEIVDGLMLGDGSFDGPGVWI